MESVQRGESPGARFHTERVADMIYGSDRTYPDPKGKGYDILFKSPLRDGWRYWRTIKDPKELETADSTSLLDNPLITWRVIVPATGEIVNSNEVVK